LEFHKLFRTFATMKRILIVDDERDLCAILDFNLRSAGYETAVAHSAEEALQRMETEQFHLLLLDVMMEGMSGFEMARHLHHSIPIIFLTAKDTEEDMLEGFQLGADDYIAKPFSIKEVLARVKAVLGRTSSTETPSETLCYEGLCIYLHRKVVTVDGEEISVTRTEFELLVLLLQEKGHVFSRQQLIERVWPKDVIVTDRTVDVNITRLRKKIGHYANHIVTRQGYGYCFEP